MKLFKAALAAAFLAAFPAFTSCTGRTAENMVPTGETVRVVIPIEDVAEDSAIATGGMIVTEQPATPDRK